MTNKKKYDKKYTFWIPKNKDELKSSNHKFFEVVHADNLDQAKRIIKRKLKISKIPKGVIHHIGREDKRVVYSHEYRNYIIQGKNAWELDKFYTTSSSAKKNAEKLNKASKLDGNGIMNTYKAMRTKIGWAVFKLPKNEKSRKKSAPVREKGSEQQDPFGKYYY